MRRRFGVDPRPRHSLTEPITARLGAARGRIAFFMGFPHRFRTSSALGNNMCICLARVCASAETLPDANMKIESV